jgi:hypothetical protein
MFQQILVLTIRWIYVEMSETHVEKNENDSVHILDCNDDNTDDVQEEEQTDLLTSHAAYREI